MVDTGTSVFCAGCWLVPDDVVDKSFTFHDKKDALLHLIDHKRAGHNPPRYAFRQLMIEILNDSRLTNGVADTRNGVQKG